MEENKQKITSDNTGTVNREQLLLAMECILTADPTLRIIQGRYYIRRNYASKLFVLSKINGYALLSHQQLDVVFTQMEKLTTQKS